MIVQPCQSRRAECHCQNRNTFCYGSSLRHFIYSGMRPHTISSVVRQCFTAWSHSGGLLVDIGSLQYFHMGSNVVWGTLPYLGLSARACTLVRHNSKPQRAAVLAYDMPLWHNSLFTNQHGQTCCCPALIRRGITTGGGVFGR